jgi:type IV pilus assembly protein PilX
MIERRGPASYQRGMVLVTSLLLLVVVTILAVGMFRSFGIDEKIAGNTREKQLALNAAESAEQYAEWWISTGANGNGLVVTPTCTASIVTSAAGQVCSNALASPITLPWTSRVNYTLPQPISLTNFVLSQQPSFYIQKLAPIALGNVYQIDAVGYGGNPNSVAVVEATFLCFQRVNAGFGQPGNGGTGSGTIC